MFNRWKLLKFRFEVKAIQRQHLSSIQIEYNEYDDGDHDDHIDDADGGDGNDDGSMLAGGVEEQRDEGVVMRGHPSGPKHKNKHADKHKKRPSSKRKYRHTMSNESQMYLQCEKETIKIQTKCPLHQFSVKGVCCVKCEMMHPLGITCLSH